MITTVPVPEGRRDPSALPSLQRVVVVNQRVVTPNGRERLVTTVELWSDHAVVRWSDSGDRLEPDGRLEDDPLRPRNRLESPIRPVLAVEDDVGTAYRVESGGAYSGSWPTDMHFHVAPKIDADAKELRVDWGDGSRTTVPLNARS